MARQGISAYGFRDFERRLFVEADRYIRANHATYTTAFDAAVSRWQGEGRDVKAGIKRFAGKHPSVLPNYWVELLGATCDLEDSIGSVLLGLRLMRAILSELPPALAGACTSYHFNNWFSGMYALFGEQDKPGKGGRDKPGKMGALIKQACRCLLREREPRWAEIQDRLVEGLLWMKTDAAEYRHALMHPPRLKGKSRLTEQYFFGGPLEPIILAGSTDFKLVIQGKYADAARRRSVWCRRLEGETAKGLAAADAVFDELSRALWPSP
jgi:hypothetical protein